ncbi:AAA family ATPase [Streptomyces sp. NPDC051784]|uniref:ParA family protein n=1 Tax=Streptomyces sp. NPDC051784 TaxID=3155805 RepID=UPI0034132E1C
MLHPHGDSVLLDHQDPSLSGVQNPGSRPQRGIPFNQGIAQAIRQWLDAHPSPRRPASRLSWARRLIFGSQKGGVGKTATSCGGAQALAEAGNRVLLIDFAPQGRLTKQLGCDLFDLEDPSLA